LTADLKSESRDRFKQYQYDKQKKELELRKFLNVKMRLARNMSTLKESHLISRNGDDNEFQGNIKIKSPAKPSGSASVGSGDGSPAVTAQPLATLFQTPLPLDRKQLKGYYQTLNHVSKSALEKRYDPYLLPAAQRKRPDAQDFIKQNISEEALNAYFVK